MRRGTWSIDTAPARGGAGVWPPVRLELLRDGVGDYKDLHPLVSLTAEASGRATEASTPQPSLSWRRCPYSTRTTHASVAGSMVTASAPASLVTSMRLPSNAARNSSPLST